MQCPCGIFSRCGNGAAPSSTSLLPCLGFRMNPGFDFMPTSPYRDLHLQRAASGQRAERDHHLCGLQRVQCPGATRHPDPGQWHHHDLYLYDRECSTEDPQDRAGQHGLAEPGLIPLMPESWPLASTVAGADPGVGPCMRSGPPALPTVSTVYGKTWRNGRHIWMVKIRSTPVNYE